MSSILVTHDSQVIRVGLDTGNASYNQLFWEGVTESYEGQDEACDNMLLRRTRLLVTSTILTSAK